MNLPIFNQLREEESTYLTFQKALVDFDDAVANNTEYYFSNCIALQLPNWENGKFFYDLTSMGLPSNTTPNLVIPKMFQYYMENICRQNISIDTNIPVENITEIAFWKTLIKMGVSPKNIVTFTNGIFTNNFIKTEANNGWVEIVVNIPNNCKLLKPAWKSVENISNLVQATDTDTALYDNGSKQFTFNNDEKTIFDFNNIKYDDTTKSKFGFNVLLLFYRDKSGIDKLHGINFIYPFENKVSYWDQQLLIQETNKISSRGYQFIFNMKSTNNQSSQIAAYEQNEQMFYVNQFGKTLGLLDSFLEEKIRLNR